MLRFASRFVKTRRVTTAAVFGTAFSIRESAVYDTPAEYQIASNQRVEKQFRFSADDPAATKAIDTLSLAAPGYTRVSFNAHGQENIVRVSSDSAEWLDAIEVVALGSNGLEIRCKKKHSTNDISGSHVLTEIFLAQPTQVKSVASAGTGVAVIDDHVLVADRPDAALSIKHAGSGKLFVTAGADTRVRSLDVALSGSGDVHFVAPSVTVLEKTSLSVGASGNLRVFTTALDTAKAKLNIAGSGDVQLATQSLIARTALKAGIAGSGTVRVYSTSIATPAMALTVAGSGDIRVGVQQQLMVQKLKNAVAGSGDIVVAAVTTQCDELETSIAGSGDVDTGDIAVKKAHVSIAGSGDVIVQVADALTYSKMGSGSIQHVGPAPPAVTGNSSRTGNGLTQLVRHDNRSVYDKVAAGWRAPTAIPAPTEAFSSITAKSSGGTEWRWGSSRHTAHSYHVEVRSWSELVDKASEFFGFGSSSAHASDKPATAGTTPTQQSFAPMPDAAATEPAPPRVPTVDLRAAGTTKHLEPPAPPARTP